jgi:hypothetical protein
LFRMKSVQSDRPNSALEQTVLPSRSWQTVPPGGLLHPARQERSGSPLLTASVKLIVSFGLLACGLFLSCGSDDSHAPTAPGYNFRPAIYPRPDTLATYGDTLKFRIRAYDPEGGEIRYGVEPVMVWGDIKEGYVVQAGINDLTGAFWFWPGPRDIPVRYFRFSADDQHGGHTVIEVRINVR